MKTFFAVTKDNPEMPLQGWDLEIKLRDELFNLNLKDIWNYRDLLWLLVRRGFVPPKGPDLNEFVVFYPKKNR